MSSRPADHDARMERARLSLAGLSVGDAFGARFTGPYPLVQGLIQSRAFPRPPWPYTDDTEMALSIVEVLDAEGCIVPDALAEAFARRYQPNRGYGKLAHETLRSIGTGASWKDVSRAWFGGEGSFGNGGAMRVSPVGAYFADDPERAVQEAKRSASVTHAHAEGQAGAMAVAAAAALAWSARDADAARFLEGVLRLTPPGAVREGLETAGTLHDSAPVLVAGATLGNGSRNTAADTVPFTVWCASRFRASYSDALWQAVGALGDRNTNGAIVGGIVALAVGPEGIPAEWLSAREPLP